MILSYSYIGAANNLPTRHELAFPALVEWLRTEFYDKRGPGPKDGPWLSFADYAGTDSEGRTGIRSYECLVASHAVPLDLDLGAYAWDAAAIQARLTGFAFIAWTSYSHTPERPRWRIVVPIERPMSRDEHYATWETLAALFAHDCGTSSKDATRLNYLPGACLHPEAAQFISGTGAPFPVSVVPEGTSSEGGIYTPSDGPVEGYAGPTDDDELLAYMLTRINGPKQAFGAEPTFADLWNANADKIALQYPPSEADQEFDHTRADAALANELAYYTGGDQGRIVELMCRAPLCDRPKWRPEKAIYAAGLALKGRTQYAFIRPAPVLSPTPDPSGGASPTTPEATPHATTQPGDFFAYLPQHDYIHRPTGMHWPAASLDGTVGKDARMMLDITLPVHLLSWAPGLPERFQWGELDSTNPEAAQSWVYNRYKAPHRPAGNGAQIDPWLKLLHRLYPNDADHILKYMADAVQNPGRKCNHALVLGSEVHGIGKDTLLKPLRHAVGERNYAIISPAEVFKDNNAWVASVVVQVSESRNVGDGDGGRISKYDMYERTKDLAAAPPATLSCVDKWVARHQVRNVLRLILTTNHGIDGIYLPPQDRRHYCAWSDAPALPEADALALHQWLDSGGSEAVAAYLYDPSLLDGWNPGARPPQTEWWHRLVLEAEGEENPLVDALVRLGSPPWVTAERIAKEGGPEVASWFADQRNRKQIGRHMGALGYRRIVNPADKRGRFNFPGKVRATVYGKPEVNAADVK